MHPHTDREIDIHSHETHMNTFKLAWFNFFPLTIIVVFLNTQTLQTSTGVKDLINPPFI